jgi:hypothetical protein
VTLVDVLASDEKIEELAVTGAWLVGELGAARALGRLLESAGVDRGVLRRRAHWS